jgi:hypothetical protein
MQGPYPAEVMQARGLPIVKADKARKPGWSTVKRYMHGQRIEKRADGEEYAVPVLRIYLSPERQASANAEGARFGMGGSATWQTRYRYGGCPHLVRTLPTIDEDPDDQDEIDEKPKDAPPPEDHCLIAGTLITTERGDVPIEQVTASDRVLTRRGWQSVSSSGMTARNADVYDVLFSDGKRITGTAGHPVYVAGKGFIRIDALGMGDDIMMVCQTPNQNPSYSMELPIADTQTQKTLQTERTIDAPVRILEKGTPTTTATCGLPPMALSQRDFISTMLTGTRSIMTSLISNASRLVSICPCTLVSGAQQRQGKSTCQVFGNLPQNGINPKQAGSGTGQTQRNAALVNGGRLKYPATTAAKSFYVVDRTNLTTALAPVNNVLVGLVAWITSKRLAFNAGSLSFPTRTTRLNAALKSVALKDPGIRAHVLRVTPSGKADVYNLTVDTVPEFFANGVLVHNCADTLRMGLHTRPKSTEAPLPYGGLPITDPRRWPEPLRDEPTEHREID